MRVFCCLIVWMWVAIVSHGMQGSSDDISPVGVDSEASMRASFGSFFEPPLMDLNPLSLLNRRLGIRRVLVRYHDTIQRTHLVKQRIPEPVQKAYLVKQSISEQIVIVDWIDEVLRHGPPEALKDSPVIDEKESVTPKTGSDQKRIFCDCFSWLCC